MNWQRLLRPFAELYARVWMRRNRAVVDALDEIRYPIYDDDELERLCPYCLNGYVELDEADYAGDCEECGRHVTFD